MKLICPYFLLTHIPFKLINFKKKKLEVNGKKI